MGAVRFSIDPALVRELTSLLPLRTFVETGTYQGDSVRAVLPMFEELHTIEVSEELHGEAAAALEGEEKVQVHLGRSQEILPRLVAGRTDPTMFWLDAHWCSDESGEEGSQCPLLDELAAIGPLHRDSVVLIDDARLFLSPPPAPVDATQWPRIGEVLAALSALSDAHDLMVLDDVIVLYPEAIREELTAWARRSTVDWLAERARNERLTGELRKLSTRFDSAQRLGVERGREQAKRVAGRVNALATRVDEIGERVESVPELVARVEAVPELVAKVDELHEAARKGGRSKQDIEGRLEVIGARVEEVSGQLDEELKGLADKHAELRDLVEASTARPDAAKIELQALRKQVTTLIGLTRSLTEEQQKPGRMSRLAARLPLPRKRARRTRLFMRRRIRPVRTRIRRARLRTQNAVRRGFRKVTLPPRLGLLYHHEPRPLSVPPRYADVRRPEDPPKISIVTPSFNHAEFLGETIESVLSQEYPDFEYIVQDGGSDDGTAAVLDEYRDHLHHVDVREDRGQAHAINLGMAHATGEIMAYLNSDDLLLPGTLDYVARTFERHPDVGVIYGHRVLIDDGGQEIGRWVMPRHSNRVLSWADFIPQETMFWRREVWEQAGARMDEDFRFALDWDLILRFRDTGTKIKRVPRFLGAFRVHEAQKSSAEVDTVGAEEMARIRRRELQRDVSRKEIHRNIRGYLRRHSVLHRLYRAGLVRY